MPPSRPLAPRRHFLRAAAGLALGLPTLSILDACAAAPSQAPAPAPLAAPTPPGASTAHTGASTNAPTGASSTGPTAPSVSAPQTAPAATSAQPIHLRLGVVGDGTGFGAYDGGRILGLWQQSGIDLEIVGHRGGAEAATSLVGGGVDLMVGEITHLFRLNDQGQNLRAIMATSGRHGYVLTAGPGTDPSLNGLAGQTIGITSPGSQTDNSMRWLLKTNGLDPDHDVQLISLGAGAPMIAGVKAKQVYAGNLGSTDKVRLGLSDWVTIYDFGAQLAPFEGTDVIGKQDWLHSNAETARRFVKGYLATLDRLVHDQQAATQVFAKTNPDVDPRLAPAIMQITAAAFVLDGQPSRDGLQKVVDVEATATGKSLQPLPELSTFFDSSYLPA